MIKSRLFLRTFSAIVVTVGLFSSAIYLFSVPLIEEKGYEIELNASHTILDNVFVMASKINGSLEDQRAITVESYKRQLTNVVSLAASYVDHVFTRMEQGEISEAEARRQVFDGLRAFKYGNNDYIWITDYNSVIQSHPDPGFQGRNAADLRDPSGEPILPTIISIARANGEGFHTYHWERLGGQSRSEKISYFKDLPRWGLVIGTGAYLDDIDEEVARRKAEAIDDLRQALRNIRIARTGYVYIFDAANNMIIHPNANIEGTEFGTLPNPATGRPINEELKAMADSDRPHAYLWDKPSDPGNYAYEKISWVRHFKGFDWYIASSVYVEELKRSSAVLGNRILTIAIAIMVLASALGYFAVRRLVRPLNQLAETAARVWSGNLNVESGIHRDDEIGVLAAAFDGMILRVRDSITTLDSRVRDRTQALEEANLRLRDAMESQAEIESRQRLILDAIPAAIAYLGRDELVRFANRRWAELVRQDKTTVVGRSLEAAIGRRAHASIATHLESTWAGAETTFEYSFLNPKGQTIVTKSSLIPQLSPSGEVTGLFVLALDITDEKETEKQLMEAQRMKAVGQLSGGLAHDFNNLLSIILGNLAAARERYAGVEGLDAYLEPAQRASRRGADITSRLLAFSRQHPMKPEPVEVCALVREIAILLRRSLPHTIDLCVPDDDLRCWAIADQNQLENALVNLALNARDAMPDGGRLDIAVGTRKVTEHLSFDERVQPDDYLEIRVSDTGTGFAPDALTRAFEPFFTTKTLGSGLGLSMVYGFVKQSHGYIRLDSAPHEGTQVTILLPRADPAPVQPLAAPCALAGATGRWQGQLALVAEDDEDVRQVMRGQLVDLGFSVVEAESGDEAFELIEQIEDLSLVVSDIVMPGLNGLDLARRVRDHHPEIRVILVSGFSVDSSADMADQVILRKPWDKQDLIAAIGPAVGDAPGD
ncbi:Signal transduction histidine kinase [Candidatus Terasakiella magnetica]|nr:Signal transduction histidine kinase [Candidatus Terasakiella magnetica]